MRTTVEQYHFRTWEGTLRALSAYIFKEYQQSFDGRYRGRKAFHVAIRHHLIVLSSQPKTSPNIYL